MANLLTVAALLLSIVPTSVAGTALMRRAGKDDADVLFQTVVTKHTFVEGSVPHTLTCADTNYDGCGESAWVKAGGHCSKPWAQKKCPKTCDQCETCSEASLGDWEDWSGCSAACGTGGQTRTRNPGDCTQGEFTQSKQCGMVPCSYSPLLLKSEGPISIDGEDGKIIENVTISTNGASPAIMVRNSKSVRIRNVRVVHTGYEQDGFQKNPSQAGVGIYFQNSDDIIIENVKVELQRSNPYVTGEVNQKCDDTYCGPFPLTMAESYNIEGRTSAGAVIRNVHLVGGSTGIWLTKCPNSNISHFKVENVHGPYPRGQCVQITYSPGATIQDFHCFIDNDIGFTEDMISIWDSGDTVVQRGLIEGGNGPTGVGAMSEHSSNTVFQDIDTTNNGGGCFSAYGADNVRFLRTRAKNNHGLESKCDRGTGYCLDWQGKNWCQGSVDGADVTGVHDVNGNWMRLDEMGNIWYAGDYNSDIGDGSYTGQASNTALEQGVFWNMAGWDTNANGCKMTDMNTWAVDGAKRSEAWIMKDYQMTDFDLRTPYVPAFEQAFTTTEQELAALIEATEAA